MAQAKTTRLIVFKKVDECEICTKHLSVFTAHHGGKYGYHGPSGTETTDMVKEHQLLLQELILNLRGMKLIEPVQLQEVCLHVSIKHTFPFGSNDSSKLILLMFGILIL